MHCLKEASLSILRDNRKRQWKLVWLDFSTIGPRGEKEHNGPDRFPRVADAKKLESFRFN